MNDDEMLTAFIDGELGEADVAALRVRLNSDRELMARLDLMRSSSLPFRAAFDALGAEAPVARMLARLKGGEARPQPSSWRRAALLGASAAAIFLIGFGFGRLAPPQGPETWRSAVAEYMELYAGTEFPVLQPEQVSSALADLSAKIGQKLEADTLAIDGLRPRYAAALAYDGAPVAQIGYQDGQTTIALCIIKDGEADAAPKTSRRGDLTEIAWAQGGRGYLAIGDASAARLEAFARAARARL